MSTFSLLSRVILLIKVSSRVKMEKSDSIPQTLCKSCSGNNDIAVKTSSKQTFENDSVDKCKQWLMEKCSLNDLDSEFSSRLSIYSESEFEAQLDCRSEIEVSSDNRLLKFDEKSITEQIESALVKNSKNIYGDVNISDSEHVVIGNVTYITGPVHITQTTSNIHRQNITNQVFLEGSIATQRTEKLRIISRLHWLAQPAFSKTPLSKPVRHVIIAHTATEEGLTQAENTLLVRLLQTFHIESKKLNDISYNFLVGSDGNVYQGRGWNVKGEHTHGYDENSIAIAFVGCFMDHLPPQSAIITAKSLIQHGMELGVIPEDYILLGQSQCLSTESPGQTLFDEIKNWPNWSDNSSVDNNSDL